MIKASEAGRLVWIAPQAVSLVRECHGVDNAGRCDVMIRNGLMIRIETPPEEFAAKVNRACSDAD